LYYLAMSSSVPTRSALVVGAILCVSLTTATVVQTSRVARIQAQLEEAKNELGKLEGTRRPSNSAAVPDEMLQQLLADKEAEYAELQQEYTELQRSVRQSPSGTANSGRAATSTLSSSGGQPGSRRGQFNAWLDRIRQEDPERYQQIVEQREQRRQRAEQAFQDQLAQLDARAQNAPTQQEADLATQLADTLAKLGDLRTQMQAARNLPEDNPQRQTQIDQVAAEMRTASQQLNDLRRQDRALQLQTLGTTLGLTDEKTQALIDGVPQIYQNTRYGGGGFGRGGGRPGGQPVQTTPTPTQPSSQPQSQQ
jgi:hypothetical protein